MFQANSLGSMRQSRMWVNEASDGPIPTLLLPRSPILSCTDSCQDFSLKIQRSKATFEEGESARFGLPTLKLACERRVAFADGALYRNRPPALEDATLTLIPYNAFANRGESDMLVWLHVKE